MKTRTTRPRFPTPDLRNTSQVLQGFKQPAPIVIVQPVPKRAAVGVVETSDCAEYRRQRVEAVTRQAPRAVITSKWTWNAELA